MTPAVKLCPGCGQTLDGPGICNACVATQTAHEDHDNDSHEED